MSVENIVMELKLGKHLKRLGSLKETIDAGMSISNSLIRETQFWHALCELVDLIAKVESYVNRKKAKRDDVFIDLQNEAPEPYNKSDAARKRYAAAQKEYRKARDEYNDADTLFSWLKTKSKAYENAMFVIKDIREQQRNVQKFTPTTEVT